MWGTACGSGACDNVAWGSSTEGDNIVWGTSSESDNVTWGCSATDTPLFDDPAVPHVFDGTVDLDGAFGTHGDLPGSQPSAPAPPPATAGPTGSLNLVTDPNSTPIAGEASNHGQDALP